MNIFVGNLSFEAKEIDVEKAFASFGVVGSVTIVMEKKGKKSRGFGFVEMPNDEEAKAAIDGLMGKDLLGRPLNVMPSNPKAPKKQFSGERERRMPVYRHTGKYREGRRTISYLKKRIAAGEPVPTDEKKYKPNPLRWRKKSRWDNAAPRTEGDKDRPWKRPEGESRGSRPWQKREGGTGESRPWQKRESGASESRPWKRSGSSSGPWKRPEGSASESRPWKISGSSFGSRKRSEGSASGSRPWKKREGGINKPRFKGRSRFSGAR